MTLIEQSSKGGASWQVDDTASLVSGSVPVARLAGRVDPSNLPVNAVYSDVQGNILGTAMLVTERAQAGFFSSLFTQSGTAYSAAVLADTPSMYWRLGDAVGTSPVADSSGNGKTGAAAGTVTLGTNGLTLDQDTAATFPGQTSPASVITGPATGIANSATFSVECLVNLTDYFYDTSGSGGGKNGQYLWDSCNGASEKTALKWNALTVSASPQKFGANSLGSADSNTLYTTGTYPAGAIYHVVYVWDASASTEYIYVNGALDTSRVSPTNTPSLSFPLVLGARPNAFSANFPSPSKGIIDEVAVYSAALSSVRVLAHYNAVSTVLPLALVYGKGINYTGDLENLVSGANQWRVDNSGTLQAGTVPSTRISGGVAPGGAASGDLGGNFPSPTVLNLSNATGANTLPDAVLSTNVPLKNAANVFSQGQAVTMTDAATTTTAAYLTAAHRSSGTPGANFGVSLLLNADSDTNALRSQAQITSTWLTATDASRTARLTLYAYDSVQARQGLAIGTDGTQALIGFIGTSPVAKQAATTDLRVALINYGLYTAGGATPLDLNGGTLNSGTHALTDGANISVGSTTGTQIGTSTSQKWAAHGQTPIALQTVTGSRASGAALVDLLAKLAAKGLIVDGTSA